MLCFVIRTSELRIVKRRGGFDKMVRWSSGRSAAQCASLENTHPLTQLRQVRVGVTHTDATRPPQATVICRAALNAPPQKVVGLTRHYYSRRPFKMFKEQSRLAGNYCSTILCLFRKTIFLTCNKALSQLTSELNCSGAQKISLSQHSFHSSLSFLTRSISKSILYLFTQILQT